MIFCKEAKTRKEEIDTPIIDGCALACPVTPYIGKISRGNSNVWKRQWDKNSLEREFTTFKLSSEDFIYFPPFHNIISQWICRINSSSVSPEISAISDKVFNSGLSNF